MFLRKTLLCTTMIASAIVVGAPSFAAAQDTTATPPAATPDGTEVDELVVTGSRIRRSEFNSVSPVQVITTEGSTLAGLVSGSEILQGASVSAGSTQINSQFTGFV